MWRAAFELDLRSSVRALPVAPALTLLGIPVALELSCVFTLALASWTVADAILPLAAPGRPALAYWTGGTTTALLLLASLAAHELAHALAARRADVRLRGISLSLFGGAIELAEPPRSAADELRIAIAGPLANFGLAVAMAVTHVVLVEMAVDPLTAAVPAVLAVLNAGLALANLIPAAPLDGGRIANALLWRITGQPGVATRALATLGRILAGLFLGVCFMSSISGDAGLALWAGLIGLTLWKEEPATRDRRVAVQA